MAHSFETGTFPADATMAWSLYAVLCTLIAPNATTTTFTIAAVKSQFNSYRARESPGGINDTDWDPANLARGLTYLTALGVVTNDGTNLTPVYFTRGLTPAQGGVPRALRRTVYGNGVDLELHPDVEKRQPVATLS